MSIFNRIKELLGIKKKPVIELNPQPQEEHKKIEQMKFKNFNALEESWKFIYRISEKILNNFSEEHQKGLLELGKKLKNTGAKYNHIVYNADKDNSANK